jgi:hypothetical protein
MTLMTGLHHFFLEMNELIDVIKYCRLYIYLMQSSNQNLPLSQEEGIWKRKIGV